MRNGELTEAEASARQAFREIIDEVWRLRGLIVSVVKREGTCPWCLKEDGGGFTTPHMPECQAFAVHGELR